LTHGVDKGLPIAAKVFEAGTFKKA
jgi:hypothetical protein